VFVDLDVTDPDQWSAAVAAVSDRWGRIDMLVKRSASVS